MSRALAALLLLGLGLPGAAEGQTATRYVAFGDSITAGTGDDPEREAKGYPPRLAAELADRGVDAEVVNRGLGGETTGEGLTRLEEVLAEGGDVLLLMEGTNDVSRRVSLETIRFNLAEMARKAAAAGLETVHATVVPRQPTARTDGSNRTTARLAGEIRDLAWSSSRSLVDPFEVFIATPDVFTDLYVGGEDTVHPNAAGYDRLALIFADALTGVDRVPPVAGLIEPADGAQEVPGSAEIRLDLFDFGEGIDLATSGLLVNGEPVAALGTGSTSRLRLRYRPATPLTGVVTVGLRAQDRAQPPNRVERTVARFQIEGDLALPGDLDGDRRVDGADLVRFALAFGARQGEGRYQAAADFDRNGIIDGSDLAVLAANFGRSA